MKSLSHLSPVILFCLFYSRIQAASQSKIDLYFPNFGDFFPQLDDFIGIYSKIQKTQAVSRNGNKITGHITKVL